MGLEAVFPDYEDLRARGFAGVACAKPVVMIAMSPRTGSTHLCAALREAGLGFEPGEIFNPRGPAGAEAARRGTPSFAAYIASLAAVPDAAFLFKTAWQDFAPLSAAARTLFPDLRVVYLDRRNIAAQAVSDFRAKTFNLWHRRPGEPAPAADLTQGFDLDRIMALLKALEAEKRGWETWFRAENITPLRLRYEDFENDVNIALRFLAAALHLPLRTDLPPGAGMERLADATSREWTLRVQKRLLNMS